MQNYNLGKKIYDNRIKLGLSQNELAKELGVTNKAVSKWENANAYPSTEILIELSNIFNISVDELLKNDIKKKKITKIVITGGPCAGKTTAMSWIQNKFIKDGYNVVFVPETATELILSGINPNNTNGSHNFQKTLLELQLNKEKIYYEAVKYLSSEKILIIYDRGAMDNKAYMSNFEFKKMLNISNLSEVELRDNYDAVFHLVTAAKGAEQVYSFDSNKARYESLEEAIKLDKRLLDAWVGHPHLKVIDNSTSFEDKMKRLINEISKFLGEPIAYEIERKFLINMPNLKELEKKAEKVEIIQTYLTSSNGDEIRIRQRGNNGNYTYYMTVKKEVSPAKRIEIEKRLTKREYLSYLMEANTSLSQIRKNRYCFIYKNQYFELDVFPFWENQAILEIELTNEHDNVNLPKFIEVINEVTENKDYKNYYLARKKEFY